MACCCWGSRADTRSRTSSLGQNDGARSSSSASGSDSHSHSATGSSEPDLAPHQTSSWAAFSPRNSASSSSSQDAIRVTRVIPAVSSVASAPSSPAPAPPAIPPNRYGGRSCSSEWAEATALEASEHDSADRPAFTGLDILPGYDCQGVLGQGAAGVVIKATRLRDGAIVAMKRLSAGREDLARMALDEISLHASLKHPRIIELFDSFTLTVGARLSVYAWMVMAYAPLGSLQDVVAKGGVGLAEAPQLLSDVAHGLAYLHRQRIVHRDVKPANILLSADPAPRPGRPARAARLRRLRAQLSDFGLAERLAKDQDYLVGHAGTLHWMAPETMDGKSSMPADVFGLGCLLHHIATGLLPGQTDPGKVPTVLELVAARQEPIPVPVPIELSGDEHVHAQAFLIGCTMKNPSLRPAVEPVPGALALLSMPYLASADTDPVADPAA